MIDRTAVTVLPRAAAALLLVAATLCGQGQGGPKAAPGRGAIADPAERTAWLVHNDARAFAAVCTKDALECTLTMAAPLPAGMFTCLHLTIDCDDNPGTGIEGEELLVRAAVGSRFQPNAAPPAIGAIAPIDHRRSSMTRLEPDGNGEVRWIHGGADLPPPTVVGNELRLVVPLELIRARGGRYASTFSIAVHVETSCSDQPIEILHACTDDGLPIVLDGKDDEWSAPAATDAADELHAAARCLDLVSLRAEHGADRLFACVDLAAPGFAARQPTVPEVPDAPTDEEPEPDGGGKPAKPRKKPPKPPAKKVVGDVVHQSSVTLQIVPQLPQYQPAVRVELVPRSRDLQGDSSGLSWRAVIGEQRIEFEIARRAGQTRFRLIATSDFVATDTFDDRLRLDWSKAGAK